MFLVFVVLVSIATVPLFGGRLIEFGRFRVRAPWTIASAIGIQLLILTIFPGPSSGWRSAAYVASYLFGAAFLLMNLKIPGVPLVTVGAGMNFIAIVTNGGVMPATQGALTRAGLAVHLSSFTNSGVVHGSRFAFLGDIFAIPSSWPLHNVFSPGDVCIGLGAAVAIHRMGGSRLFPSGERQFRPLFRQRGFARLWSAQAVSNVGDWMYAIAVATTLAVRTKSPAMLAVLLIVQAGTAAVFGVLLGPLVDRYPRRLLMFWSDVTRAAALLLLLLLGHSSPVALFLVAGCLGVFGALFQPSLQASVPNIVPEEHLLAANSLISMTFNFSLVVGPAVGGLIVARFGAVPVFVIDMVSFAVSAILVVGLPLSERRRAPQERAPVVHELREGIGYVLRTPIVRGVIVVFGLLMLGAATKAPLESLFVLGTLSSGPQALGLLGASWGIGMVLGAMAAPAWSRRTTPERQLFFCALGTGSAILLVSRTNELSVVLIAWLVAGAANGAANVCFNSLLQQRTPDNIRGRVFAASEAVLDVAYLCGGVLAAWVGGHVGIRAAYATAGLIMVAAAVVCRVMVRQTGPATSGKRRSRGATAGPVDDRPATREVVDAARSSA